MNVHIAGQRAAPCARRLQRWGPVVVALSLTRMPARGESGTGRESFMEMMSLWSASFERLSLAALEHGPQSLFYWVHLGLGPGLPGYTSPASKRQQAPAHSWQ